MSAPLISVVMPVREMRAYTHQAIASILEQTHHQLELVLIGQPDQPPPTDLPQDNRIRWIGREQPGIVGALNTGLSCATGDYIARMDDDDIAHPDRLSCQLDHLLAHRLDFCGARIQFFNENDQVGEGNQRYANWLNKLTSPQAMHQSIFIESPIPHPSFFAATHIWQQLRGYKDNDWPEDYDLLLRAWQLGLTMGKPEPILLNWREHPNRLTYTDSRYSKQAFVNAKAATLNNNHTRFNLDQRPIWIAGTGRNARYWFDALQRNGVPVDGFVDIPRLNMKSCKRGISVINYETYQALSTDRFLIIALGCADARTHCIDWCVSHGLVQMTDFIAG